MAYLQFSEQESKILGLRVARGQGNLSQWDRAALEREIIAGEYDLCRIKADLSDSALFDSLAQLVFPSEIYTINYRNRKAIPIEPAPLPTGIGYREYAAGDEKLLASMLKKISRSRSWQEFASPLLQHLIPDEKEKELFMDYFSSFLPQDRKGAHTYFLYHKDSPAGVFMGIVQEGVFSGALYGILPEYRGKGFSKSVYIAMEHICGLYRLPWFENDIHLLNFASQRSALSSKLAPENIFVNLSLFPLLTKLRTDTELQPDSAFSALDFQDEAVFADIRSRIFAPAGNSLFSGTRKISLKFEDNSAFSAEMILDDSDGVHALRYIRQRA